MRRFIPLFTVLLAACGEVVVEPPLEPPVACGAAANVVMYKFGDVMVDVCFKDANVSTLTYDVQSSNPEVITAEMQGVVVTLTAHTIGGSEITVTATNEAGLSGSLLINAVVSNRNPESCLEQSPPHLALMSEPLVIPFCFLDPDAHDMTYSASASDPSIVDLVIRDTTIVVTAKAQGDVEITIAAKDSYNGTATAVLQTQTPNRPPEVCRDLPTEGGVVFVGESREFSFCIRDPDGHALEELITAGDELTATLNAEQNILYVTGVTVGVDIPVNVRLTDPYGESAETSMLVSVRDQGTEVFYDEFSDSTGGWQATPPVPLVRTDEPQIGKGYFSIENGFLNARTVEEGGWGGTYKDLAVEDWTVTARIRSLCDCTGNLIEIFREDDIAYWILMQQGISTFPYLRFAFLYRDYSDDENEVDFKWFGEWWGPGEDHRGGYQSLIPNFEWAEISISTVSGDLRFSINGQLIRVVYDEEMVFSKMRRIRLLGFNDGSRHIQNPAQFDFIRVVGTAR